MRLLSVLTSAALLLAAAAASAATAKLPAAPESVDFPGADGTVHALLYKPQGDGPFAVVIAMHGCSGLTGHGGQIQPRYRDWAEHLVKAGDAVLFPDSYGSRNAGTQCRAKDRKIFARRQRAADIRAAQQWLIEQSWVQHDHIGLLGWANGASAVLWAVRPQTALAPWHDDFRSAVAFYPDCRISSRLGWSARVPTLVLTGGADEVSSSAACRQMVDDARGRSALVRIVVYPGAHHDSDRGNVHQASDAADRGQGHGRIAISAASRAASQKQIMTWLAR